MIRATFRQLATAAQINSATGVLSVASSFAVDLVEISVVYYRAGYSPDDYTTDTDYQTRFTLESSRAIKCPSIPLQLSGTKKMQEYISQPGALETILHQFDDSVITPSDADTLRSSWMEMWSLEGVGHSRAESEFRNLVVKPQREGGGNNIYRKAIPDFLKSLPLGDRGAWIAMRLIAVPHINNLLIKTGDGEAAKSSTASELGIFGWSLFSEHKGKVETTQSDGGWLLRTKGSESNEGGIAVGISVLDTPLLV